MIQMQSVKNAESSLENNDTIKRNCAETHVTTNSTMNSMHTKKRRRVM